jgi:hypothetical protein
MHGIRIFVVVPSLLLAWSIAAWAQLPATSQAVAPPAASPTKVSIVQVVILLAAMAGSFLAYKSHEGAATLSWPAAGTVIFSGCATYLAMVNGYIPTSVFDSAGNALTAAVIAILISGLAGAVLVEMFRKMVAGFGQLKSGDKP